MTPTFFDTFAALCADPSQPVAEASVHVCELRPFQTPAFTGRVFAPHDGCVYVAPVGIVRYVAVHWYRPPEVFVYAVLACPTMCSADYRRALLANGVRSLIARADR